MLVALTHSFNHLSNFLWDCLAAPGTVSGRTLANTHTHSFLLTHSFRRVANVRVIPVHVICCRWENTIANVRQTDRSHKESLIFKHQIIEPNLIEISKRIFGRPAAGSMLCAFSKPFALHIVLRTRFVCTWPGILLAASTNICICLCRICDCIYGSVWFCFLVRMCVGHAVQRVSFTNECVWKVSATTEELNKTKIIWITILYWICDYWVVCARLELVHCKHRLIIWPWQSNYLKPGDAAKWSPCSTSTTTTGNANHTENAFISLTFLLRRRFIKSHWK